MMRRRKSKARGRGVVSLLLSYSYCLSPDDKLIT